MVTQNKTHELWESEFVIRPNRSLSWNAIKAIFVFFLIVSGLVAGYFWLKGAWLVLPFTGAEMLVLGFSLYLNALCGDRREVIRIGTSEILVQKGRLRVESEERFHRHWATVRLVRDPNNWYPSRLYIGSHGKSVEIGNCLLDSEREQLALDLRSTFRSVQDDNTVATGPEKTAATLENKKLKTSWG